MVMTLIPALGRQRQVDLWECKACLVYRVSSRVQRNPVLKNQREREREREREKERCIFLVCGNTWVL